MPSHGDPTFASARVKREPELFIWRKTADDILTEVAATFFAF
ncbi:MAG: hypothetical protein AAGA56_03005 [Myxococcota bacterium]